MSKTLEIARPAGASYDVTKVFTLTGELKDNSFEGIAAGIGNIDRGRDVIAPGAFEGKLDAFVKDGSAMLAHQWGETPIGFITTAEERENELLVRATFHTTHKAQEVRTIMEERLAAGKSVGLSIGFRIDEEGDKFFETGDDLIVYAKALNLDLDFEGIALCKGFCHLILKAKEVYEVSFAAIQMNPKAIATSVKSMFGGDGGDVPLRLQDHSETVHALVTGMVSRYSRYLATRTADDNPVTADRMAEAKSLLESFSQLVEKMEATTTKPAPTEDNPEDDADRKTTVKKLQEHTLRMRSDSLTG